MIDFIFIQTSFILKSYTLL